MSCSIVKCKNDGIHEYLTKSGFRLNVCDYHKQKKIERNIQDKLKYTGYYPNFKK